MVFSLFRLFFKMTPLQHRGGSPPTSFILFWKLNTVAVVSWKNGGGGGRLNLPVAMVTPQSSRYYCLTLWFLQFSDFYSKWPPPTTPGRVPSFILFWKVDTPSVVPWKGRHTRGRMVTLQMSKDGFLPHILTLWCLAFFRLFSKWPPEASPPTSFILFWKVNTVAVVSWTRKSKDLVIPCQY